MNQVFVYAGYVFTDRNTLEIAKRKYMHANKILKRALKRTDELKAANLSPVHKRSLFNSVRQYDSVDVVVDISRVYDHILANKKAICRYKDYALKRCVKNKVKSLITDGLISKDEEIVISIYIDEQLTATDGYYDLRDSIKEELQYGIVKWAEKTVREYHEIASRKEVNLAYYTQSDLSLISEKPELMIVGINPGSGGTYKEQCENKNWSYLYNNNQDQNHLLKGNYCREEGKPSSWENHRKWGYWKGLKRCLSQTILKP